LVVSLGRLFFLYRRTMVLRRSVASSSSSSFLPFLPPALAAVLVSPLFRFFCPSSFFSGSPAAARFSFSSAAFLARSASSSSCAALTRSKKLDVL
jgi:hypothetical protein